MKHSERFNNAVTKLYNAFHSGKLNAYSCRACAVGNICDNKPSWAEVLPSFASISILSIKKTISERGLKHNETTIKTGYSIEELSMIEGLFMQEHSGELPTTIHEQFNGLCAVVKYLCDIEGIPNIMDYSKLFETENNKPKYELAL